jgi:hypothetical protein
MKLTTKLWIGLGVLAALSPVGLILPDKLKAGPAWGEWATRDMHGLVGYIPSGLKKLSSLWNGIMPGYAIKAWEGKGIGQVSIGYIIAAILGIALCAGAGVLLGKWLAKRKQ